MERREIEGRKGEEKGEGGILVGPIDSRKLGVGPLGGGEEKNACIKEAASPGKEEKKTRGGGGTFFQRCAQLCVPR